MPKLEWGQQDQVRAFNEWKDFLESYMFISGVENANKFHYIKLSAGTQGKDFCGIHGN